MSKNEKKSSKGGKSVSLFIIISLVISVIACIGCGYVIYQLKVGKAIDSRKAKPAVVAAAPVNPIYVPLESITVSLTPSESENDHVLYIGLTLRVKNDSSKAVLDKYLPEVRSRLFILLAHQTADDISTDEGKTNLIEKIKSVVSKPLAPNQSILVTDVLFNAFILR